MGHLQESLSGKSRFRCFARLTIRVLEFKLHSKPNVGGYMKVLAKIFCVVTLVSVIAGCASDSIFIPKLPPEAQAKLLDYYEQPDNKVFIIAIDPGGDFAYGYDYGKATLKEAAKVAVEKCDASRETIGVIARPYVYALNDKVVYEDMIRAAEKADSPEEEREAQAEEIIEEDASEGNAPAEETAEEPADQM